jgi:tetratricopeptide (TPR) repeat protein
MQRWGARVQGSWQRLLITNISWEKGYLFLGLLTLLVLSLGMANRLYQESRLVEAIRRDPYSVEAYDELWSLYWETPSWPKRGQTTFQRLAAEYPDNPRPLVELAWLDYNLIPVKHTMTPEGLRWADQAMQLASDDDESLLSLAWLYFVTDEFEKAAQAAQKSLDIVPDSSEAHLLAGRALKRSGDLEAAEREFRACVETTLSDEWPSDLCYTELITATREMTVVLQADQMTIQARAELDEPLEEVREFLSRGTPTFRGRYLAWGVTSVGPRGYGIARSDAVTKIELEPKRAIVYVQAPEIDYDDLLLGVYDPDEGPTFTIEDLPLTSYSMPTTITVAAEGARVISATHPYETIHGDAFSWQMSGSERPGQALGIAIGLDRFNEWKLILMTNRMARALVWVLLYATPTVWAILVFIRMRQAAQDMEETAQENNGDFVHRVLRPQSVFSWLFDLALLALAILTVLYPLWLLIIERYLYVSERSYHAFVLVLGLLMLRLAASDWHRYRRDGIIYVHLGAIIFACYLGPRLYYFGFGPVYLAIGAAVYYLVLVRDGDWLAEFDWQRLRQLFSRKRKALVERIVSLDQLSGLERAAHVQDLALAKGTLKAAEYEASQEALGKIIKRREKALDQLRDELGIPAGESPKVLLFRLGPAATPTKNSLVALGFGSIPFLIFMMLALSQQDIEITSFYETLRVTVGVPWGPIYLFFYGYFFHILWGKYGTTKGLVFGGVLVALNALFEWLWLWDQVDGVELWGIAIRILVTFVFVGAMMDWMTVQFSWRRVRLSYDSPAFTTIITIIGTAVATVATGLATGTMDRLLSIALQTIPAAFGAPPLPGP